VVSLMEPNSFLSVKYLSASHPWLKLSLNSNLPVTVEKGLWAWAWCFIDA
jgi:hypothetical protein